MTFFNQHQHQHQHQHGPLRLLKALEIICKMAAFKLKLWLIFSTQAERCLFSSERFNLDATYQHHL